MIAIVGGAKVSTKLDLLENLVTKVDALVIGGGMANTFLHAQGVERRQVAGARRTWPTTARRIMEKAEAANCAIILPVDAVVAFHFAGQRAVARLRPRRDPGRRHDPRRRPAVGRAHQGRDRRRRDAGLERPARRVRDRRRSIAARWRPRSTRPRAPRPGKLVSVAGGGDTVAALNHAGVADDFTYVSTAGGAFLEWMEGKPLPGVEALRNRS